MADPPYVADVSIGLPSPAAPLTGVRVLELVRGVDGALAGELLALLGAEVVKIESTAGDPARFAADGRTGAAFALANLSKQSVTVGADPASVQLVGDLLRRADVVIDNSRVHASANAAEGAGADVDPPLAGFDLDAATSDNLRLVHLALVGPEDDWDLADLPLSEVVLQCLSGIASITGEPSEAPLRVGPDAAANAAAIYGVIGVLAALIQRDRTGRGQRVEVSLLDAAINLCRTHYSRSAESGEFHPRPGNRQPAAQAEPTGMFPAAGDGPQDYVSAHASPEHLWRRLLTVIGREDLLDDARFADGPSRLAHRDEVHVVIDEWTRQHPAVEILRRWGDAGIPVGAALTTSDLAREPSLHSDGHLATIAQPGWGDIVVPVLPFTVDGHGPLTPSPVTELGADTAAAAASVSNGPVPTAVASRAAGPDIPALAGVRVLDFTQALSGPTATQVFALLGADVVRVQRPAAPSLGIERPWLKLEQLSMNKRSMVLDLKTESGRDVVRQLVPRFDVVMENFAPGTMERLGFDRDAIRALNPSAVYGRIKGFNPGSPYRDYLAFDNVAEAMGTACALTGNPDEEPMLPGPHLGDIGTGLVAAMGVLAQLYARTRTGHGTEVVCSMQSTVGTVFSRLAFAAGLTTGKVPMRNGFGEIGSTDAPVGAYRTAGGGMNDYCYLGVHNDAQWHALTSARPELRDDPRFDSAEQRWRHRSALDAEIERWTAHHDKRSLAHRLAGVGVPAAPVLDTAELMHDPVLQRRGVFTTVPHPVRGHVWHVHWPIVMSRSHVPMTPAPAHGEHTDEILAAMTR